MMLVDTHAHLTNEKFRDDLDAVVQRATDAGVGAMITLATNLDDCEESLKLADRFPSVYAAVGVHPNEADGAPLDVTDTLAAFAKHPKVVAIGEAGMDYHYLPSLMQRKISALVQPSVEIPAYVTGAAIDEEAIRFDAAYKARQRRTFIQQLDLAVRLDKPIVIHQRDCLNDLLDVLTPYGGKVRGVFHCFSESIEVAQRVLKLGFYVSFTGMLTFKRNTNLREMAAQLPLDRVMIETDCPYMTPEPHRGKRCEPAFVTHTAAALAAARGTTVEELAEKTTDNARRLFGLASQA
jgi:TatD DNase family protein